MGQTSAGTVVINLRANLVDFKQGMNDATGAARDSTRQLSSDIGGSMRESVGSMRLLEGEIGIAIPRELNRVIASIPGVQAAFSAILPIVGVTAAIAVIGKLIEKHEEARRKMVELAIAQQEAGLHGQESFNKVGDEILSVQKEIDELNHNHLASLHDTLVLLDHTTLRELKAEFASFAKDADEQMSKIQTHWYHFWISQTEGTKEAFDTEKERLDSLAVAANKPGLTDNRRAKAIKAYNDELDTQLARQKEIVRLETVGAGSLTGLTVNVEKVKAAREELAAKYNIQKVNEDSLRAEQAVLGAYQNQRDIADATFALKKKTAELDVDKSGKKVAEEQAAASEIRLSTAKKTADTLADYYTETAKKQYEISAVTLDQEVDAEKVAAQLKLDAERTFIEGKKVLERSSNDAPNVKSAKMAELNAQLENAQIAFDKKMEDIDSDAAKTRLAIWEKLNHDQIEIGMRNAKTNWEIAQAEATAAMEKAQEEAKGVLAAKEEENRHKVAIGVMSNQEAAALDREAERQAVTAEVAAINERQKSLNKSHADELRAWQKLENDKNKIIDKGNQDQKKEQDKANEDMIKGYETVANKMAASVSKQIVEGKGLAKNMESMGKEMLEEFIKNMLLMKLPAAKGAAAKQYEAYSESPQPVPTIMAAAAFAGVMALEAGGPTLPGESYLVGEKGPEIWSPGASGFVTPNSELAKGAAAGAGSYSRNSGNLTMQISTPDANSFHKSQSQLMSKAHHAQAAAKRRNG